jgi:hypothetical protein
MVREDGEAIAKDQNQVSYFFLFLFCPPSKLVNLDRSPSEREEKSNYGVDSVNQVDSGAERTLRQGTIAMTARVPCCALASSVLDELVMADAPLLSTLQPVM